MSYPLIFGAAAIALISTKTDTALPALMLVAPAAVQIHWIAPPPPRIVVTPAPRAGWVWSPGYWRWTGRNYFWVEGMWLPLRRGYQYFPAHWERRPGGWILIPATWLRRPL